MRFSFAKSSDDKNQLMQNAKFSWILGFLSNEIIISKYIYVIGTYVPRSFPPCQTGPKFKFKTVEQKVWKNNSRDFKKIWLL